MISKKTFSLNSLLAITSLVVALNSTVSNAMDQFAPQGAGLVKSTHFGFFAPKDAWKMVKTNGEVTEHNMDAPKNGFAYTYGKDGAKITYYPGCGRDVQAINLHGHKPGSITNLSKFELGSVVNVTPDNKRKEVKLVIKSSLLRPEFEELKKDQEFQNYLTHTDGFEKFLRENKEFFSKNSKSFEGLSNEAIFEKLYVESDNNKESEGGKWIGRILTHNITLTGRETTNTEYGFNAQENDYSSLEQINLKGPQWCFDKKVIIDADNKDIIHLQGTEDHPNFAFNIFANKDDETDPDTKMQIKTPLQVNEPSLKGFDGIELSSTLELIELENKDFRVPALKLDYKKDDAMLVVGTDATDGKKVVLNKLVEPTRDNQYRLGVRSTHEGGVLTLDQNRNDIGVSETQRYKQLVLEGKGGIKLSGSGNIFAKEIIIKDSGDKISFDKEINSGQNSSLLFTGQRIAEVSKDLSIEKIDLNNTFSALELTKGATIKGHILNSEPRGFVKPATSASNYGLHVISGKVIGEIDNIPVTVSGPFRYDGKANVLGVTLDNEKSNLELANNGQVRAWWIDGTADQNTKITFLGNGEIVTPEPLDHTKSPEVFGIQVGEIHSNGAAGSVAKLSSGEININKLKYLHDNTVKVTKNASFTANTIDFNGKKAVLEIEGRDVSNPKLAQGKLAYGFNTREVKNSHDATLKITKEVITGSGEEVFKIKDIILGERSARGIFVVDISNKDIAIPTTTNLKFENNNSILAFLNRSGNEDRTITFTSRRPSFEAAEKTSRDIYGYIALVNENPDTKLILQAGRDAVDNAENNRQRNHLLQILGHVEVASNLDIRAGVKEIDIDLGGKLVDFSGETLKVSKIKLGHNGLPVDRAALMDDKPSAEQGAHYIVDVKERNANVEKGVEIDYNKTKSIVELRNSGSHDRTVVFNGEMHNGEKGKLIAKSLKAWLNLEGNSDRQWFNKQKELQEFKTIGTVRIPHKNPFDIGYAKSLKIKGEQDDAKNEYITGIFIDEGGSTAKIKDIEIGDADAAALYVLDAVRENITVHSNIAFGHIESELELRNSSSTHNRTIKVTKSILPKEYDTGRVRINSEHNGRKLKIAKGGSDVAFGSESLKLKDILFEGDGLFNIEPAIYTTNISLKAKEIALNQVYSNVTFLRNTKYYANGDIKGDIHFNGHNGELILAKGVKVEGNIDDQGGDLYKAAVNVAQKHGIIILEGKNEILARDHIIAKELHSNGKANTASILKAEREITLGLLKYAHANTIQVLGDTNTKIDTINFNGKEAVLELDYTILRKDQARPGVGYNFTVEEVKNAKHAALKILGEVYTNSGQEVFKISEIILGKKAEESTKEKVEVLFTRLLVDVSDKNLTIPAKTKIEFKNGNAVLAFINLSTTEDRTVTFESPKLFKGEFAAITFASQTKKLFVEADKNAIKDGSIPTPLPRRLRTGGDIVIGEGIDLTGVQNIFVLPAGVISSIPDLDLDSDEEFGGSLIDHSGTTRAASRIILGENSNAKEVTTAHTRQLLSARPEIMPVLYKVDVKNGNSSAYAGLTLDFSNTASRAIFENTGNEERTIEPYANVENAENGKVVVRSWDAQLNLVNNGSANSENTVSLGEFVTAGDIKIPHKKPFDLGNVKLLKVKGRFVDEGATSANASKVEIGTHNAPATYVVDAILANFKVNSDIKFAHKNSAYELRNSAEHNRTITLTKDIKPTENYAGRVIVHSTHSGRKLTIADNTKKLGNRTHRLKEIVFKGDGDFDIQPKIFAENLSLDVNKISLGAVNLHEKNGDEVGNIIFLRDTIFHADGNIKANILFNGHNGQLILANGVKIKGNIDGTGGELYETPKTANLFGIIKFKESGEIIAPDHIIAKEIHSNGDTHAVAKLEAKNIETDLLKFKNANKVQITGNFTVGTIDYNNKAGVLELLGEGPYDFNPTLVANAGEGTNSTLNIIGKRFTKSKEIFKFDAINLGNGDSIGYLDVDIDKVLTVPSYSDLDFKHPQSVLKIRNSSTTDDAVLNINTDLAVLDSVNGYIILESLTKTLTLRKGEEVKGASQANNTKTVSFGSGPKGSVAKTNQMDKAPEEELLEKLTIRGNVIIAYEDFQGVNLSRTKEVEVMEGATFADYPGEILDPDGAIEAARKISIGKSDFANASAKTGQITATYISGINGSKTVPDNTSVDFLSTAAKLIMQNVGPEGIKAIQKFGGQLLNAENGQIDVIGGSGGIDIQRTNSQGSGVQLGKLNIYDTVTFLNENAFKLNNISVANITENSVMVNETGLFPAVTNIGAPSPSTLRQARTNSGVRIAANLLVLL